MWAHMNETENDRRIVRMLRECKASAAPALLLAAAWVAFAAAVALSAFLRAEQEVPSTPRRRPRFRSGCEWWASAHMLSA